MSFENHRGWLRTLELWRSDSHPTVICSHGFGADASDLFPLHEYLDPKGLWNWVFPDAPVEVNLGGGASGRAWFPLDLADLDRRMREATPRAMALENPKGLKEAREALDAVATALPTPREKIVFAGFSQGAMMSIDCALRNSLPTKGLMILSGSIMNESEWKENAAKQKGMRFFQSHGSSDPLLAYEGAKQLSRLLKDGGCIGELQGFSGGHEIPPPIILSAAKFLLRLSES